MVRKAAVLQRKSDDVGWFLRGIRSVDGSERVSTAAAHPGVDFPFQYNIFGTYEMQWLTFTSGVTGNSNLFGSSSFWASNAREMYMAHSAFQSYDKLVGNPSAVFQKWLAHPVPDAYYDAMVPSPEQYKKISL